MEKMAMSFLIIILSCFIVQGMELLLTSSPDKNPAPGFTPCDNNTDCEHFLNSVCSDNFCECNGTKFCQDKTGTVVTKIGEFCKSDADCNIEHSVCKGEKCVCEEGRVHAANGRKCLKLAAALGSTCEEDMQCYTRVTHSSCQNEKCKCEEQMHEYQGSCYRSVALGSDCQLTGECSATSFARCMDQRCACKKGYVQSQIANKCLNVITKIDGLCYEDIQCSTDLGKVQCKQGRCQCAEMYQFKFNTSMCVRDLRLGDFCQNHTDCHGPEEGESRSECILGVCKCKSEFHEELGFCTSAGIPSVRVPSVLMLLLAPILRVYFIEN